MANKNTKRIKREIDIAGRAGNNVLTIDVPAPGYHNGPKGSYVGRNIPLTRGSSVSESRNMAQRVLHNTGADGKVFSVTVHEPLTPGSKFRPFTRHKLRQDDKGNPIGLGNPQPWVYPGQTSSANYARPSVG